MAKKMKKYNPPFSLLGVSTSYNENKCVFKTKHLKSKITCNFTKEDFLTGAEFILDNISVKGLDSYELAKMMNQYFILKTLEKVNIKGKDL